MKTIFSAAILFTLLLVSAANSLFVVGHAGHDHDKHDHVAPSPPPSNENELFWAQRRISIDHETTPLRLVQFDFPSMKDEQDHEANLCDVAVGDVYDLPLTVGRASTLYELLDNNKNNNQEEHLHHSVFPPVSKLDHGLVGVHSEKDHHEFTFAFRMKKDSNQQILVGGSFIDPRLHVGELRNEHGENKHDDHHNGHEHDHKHNLFYVRHDEGHNIRIPRDVEVVEIYCNNKHSDTEQRVRLSFNIHELEKHAPRYTPHNLRPVSPLRRSAKDLAAASTSTSTGTGAAKIFPLKVRGPPATQFNIIFLSDGFTAAQEGLYNDSVTRALQFLDPTNIEDVKKYPDLKNIHNTHPIDRFFPFSNVYSVFQASAQSGCSRPLYGIGVNDNLQCYHPETIERAITCNRQLVMALASMTPANPNANPDQCLIITAVNTPIYGGSASYSKGNFHVGYFYQGKDGANMDTYDLMKYASLVNHEAGHSILNLMDEYDIGLTQSATINFPNCQAPAAGQAPTAATTPKLQWLDWSNAFATPGSTDYNFYSAGVTSSLYGVKQTPIPICGYSNYYKPNSNCMMQQLRDYYLCPVCRDFGTRTLLSLTKLSFAWPRFPVEDATLVIPQTAAAGKISVATGVVFHLPLYLATAGDFSVTWQDPNGNTISAADSRFTINPGASCSVCLRLESSYLAALVKDTTLTITAKINDNSNFAFSSYKIQPAYKNLFYQNTSFKFKVITGSVLPADAQLQPTLIATGAFGYDPSVDANVYATVCLPRYPGHQPVCNLTFETIPYQAPQALDDELNGAEFWVYIVIGGCAVVFILAWIGMASKFNKLEQGRVRPIFESKFGGAVDCIYRIMNYSAIGFMLMSLATLGAAGFMYSRISAIGKVVIFPGIMLAIGLFIMAFAGFWSLKLRSIRLIVINGVVLYGGFTVLFVATAVVVDLGSSISDRTSYWYKYLRIFWEDMVKSSPDRACGFESMLACSGFFISCTGVGASPDFCPENCAPNTEYGTPCQKRLQDWVSDNYTIITAVCLAALLLMAFALLFNLIFFFNLVKMKADIRKKLENQFESSHIGQFGRRSDPDAPDRALKFLQTLGEHDSEKLVTEFRRIDKDGNGELDPNELRAFFKKAFCFRVSMDQIKYLFSVADRDGSGTISVPEFLALFEGGQRSARTYSIRPGGNGDDLARSTRIENVIKKSQSSTNFNRMAGQQQSGDGDSMNNRQPLHGSPKIGGLLHVPSNKNAMTPGKSPVPSAAANHAAMMSPRNGATTTNPNAAFPMTGMKGGLAANKNNNNSESYVSVLGGKKPAGKVASGAAAASNGEEHHADQELHEQPQQGAAKPDLIDSLLEGDGTELMML